MLLQISMQSEVLHITKYEKKGKRRQSRKSKGTAVLDTWIYLFS